MLDEIEIRHANIADIDDIILFNKEMAWETEKKVLDIQTLSSGVRQVLENNAEAFYLVATVNSSKIAGSLMVTKEWSDWRNAFIWWIQSVYVLPEFRRKGIYDSLYKKAKDLGRDSKCCAFRLYVEENNSTAQKTYFALGMKKLHYFVYEEVLNGK